MFTIEVRTVHTVEKWKIQMLNTNEATDIFSESISNCFQRPIKIFVKNIHTGQ
jgi:hypothetical protein